MAMKAGIREVLRASIESYGRLSRKDCIRAAAAEPHRGALRCMRKASETWILAIQAKHVKEVPLDPSLLAQGAKNYGTHRLRRRGLPTHVPKAWLGQHPAAASGLCSPVKSEVGNPYYSH